MTSALVSSGLTRLPGLQIHNRSGRIQGIGRPSAPPVSTTPPFPAMTTTTIALLIALLLLPVLILLWATESRQQRARRWRRDGWTQQRIADRLGCSRTTVRRLLAA